MNSVLALFAIRDIRENEEIRYDYTLGEPQHQLEWRKVLFTEHNIIHRKTLEMFWFWHFVKFLALTEGHKLCVYMRILT